MHSRKTARAAAKLLRCQSMGLSLVLVSPGVVFALLAT